MACRILSKIGHCEAGLVMNHEGHEGGKRDSELGRMESRKLLPEGRFGEPHLQLSVKLTVRH